MSWLIENGWLLVGVLALVGGFAVIATGPKQ